MDNKCSKTMLTHSRTGKERKILLLSLATYLQIAKYETRKNYLFIAIA